MLESKELLPKIAEEGAHGQRFVKGTSGMQKLKRAFCELA